MTMAPPIESVACTTEPSGAVRRDSSSAANAAVQNSISAAASRHTSIGITSLLASRGTADILHLLRVGARLALLSIVETSNRPIRRTAAAERVMEFPWSKTAAIQLQPYDRSVENAR